MARTPYTALYSDLDSSKVKFTAPLPGAVGHNMYLNGPDGQQPLHIWLASSSDPASDDADWVSQWMHWEPMDDNGKHKLILKPGSNDSPLLVAMRRLDEMVLQHLEKTPETRKLVEELARKNKTCQGNWRLLYSPAVMEASDKQYADSLRVTVREQRPPTVTLAKGVVKSGANAGKLAVEPPEADAIGAITEHRSAKLMILVAPFVHIGSKGISLTLTAQSVLMYSQQSGSAALPFETCAVAAAAADEHPACVEEHVAPDVEAAPEVAAAKLTTGKRKRGGADPVAA